MIEEPVIGIRFWRYLRVVDCPANTPMCDRWTWSLYKENRLYSTMQGAPWERVWEPGVQTAKCLAMSGHKVPEQRCHCGLHAFYTLDDAKHGAVALGLYRHNSPLWMVPSVVMGIVRGWGSVRIHPNGWRSERAEILALFQHSEGRDIRHLAKIYEVPLLPMGDVDTMLLEYGNPVPDHLKPKNHEGSRPHT